MADLLAHDPTTPRAVRTLDDVAVLSGVSRATVSRVINGRPVADATFL
jgi:transcriptional regulator with XRE-family HTH domain